MLAKYNQLAGMLNEEYNVSFFSDNGEESLLISKNDLYVTVCIDDDKLYVLVEEHNDRFDEYLAIDSKWYKTPKGAYNFIKKILA